MLFTIYPAANIVLVAWLVASSVSVTITPYILLLLGYVNGPFHFFVCTPLMESALVWGKIHGFFYG